MGTVYRLSFLLFVGALIYGLFRAAPPPDLFEHADKLMHVSAMCALVLGARVYVQTVPMQAYSALALLIVATLEPLQAALVVTRHGSLADGIANLVGAVLAIMLMVLVQRRAQRSHAVT